LILLDSRTFETCAHVYLKIYANLQRVVVEFG